MPISQTTITGSFRRPNNTDAALSGVIFHLAGNDFEAGEGVVSGTVYAAVVTESGDFTISVWPNDRGVIGNTSYRVEIGFEDGSVFGDLRSVWVSHSDTPKTLEDVVFETRLRGKVAPYSLRIVTQAEYDAASPAPNTLYLIRG